MEIFFLKKSSVHSLYFWYVAKFSVFYTLTQPRTWGSDWSHAGDICFFKQNKLKKKTHSETRKPNPQGSGI